MKNTDVRPPVIVLVLAISIVVIAASGCARGPAANANVNLNTNTNVNVNANTTGVSNINASTAPSTIAAKEPETYRATIVFSAETEGGDKAIGIPTLSAEVAKSGSDRRLSFKLPDGSDLVYLEKAGTRKPLFRIGRDMWAWTAGLGYQMQLAGRDFAVEKSAVFMFTDAFAPDGTEDALVTIAPRSDHRAFETRQGDVLVGSAGFVEMHAVPLTPYTAR